MSPPVCAACFNMAVAAVVAFAVGRHARWISAATCKRFASRHASQARSPRPTGTDISGILSAGEAPNAVAICRAHLSSSECRQIDVVDTEECRRLPRNMQPATL
jgi:hypothetical protein